MRPVDKGTRTQTYEPYGSARKELGDTIGEYCSYCEMPINQLLNVEHVVPISKGGNEFSWKNFLLACTYCNGASNKSNHNDSRAGYFWPDEDNTFFAFDYDEINTIQPATQLDVAQAKIGIDTINLLGLDRTPSSSNPPTLADTRWSKRVSVWGVAKESLLNWEKVPSPEMQNQIINTVLGHGFFSIWMTVFEQHSSIKLALIEAFPGTDSMSFNIVGNSIARPNGQV